jgi:hypothetical protein
MMTNFDDFCTWVLVVVDDLRKPISPFFRHPEPKPECTDSELIAVSLIGECLGWHMGTEQLSCFIDYRHLFPHIPSQNRFNQRRRTHQVAINLIRQVLLRSLDLSQDRKGLIDRVPIPVVQFHLVPSSTGDWKASEVAFGKAITKKQTFFGYRLHF